jgi:hypothetical protein
MPPTLWQPPAEVRGWKLAGPPQHVTRDSVFDYMDGAGELYLAYAFNGLDAWTFTRPGEGPILLEVYDMSRPEGAFGVLSQDLDGPDAGVGDRSVYAAGLLRYCRGRYFVRVLAEVETKDSKEAVMQLAAGFAKTVTGRAALPPLVARLPKHGLKPQTVHYFHRKVCLDYLYYLATENILGLDEKTDAVMADYVVEGGKARLLVVEYPSDALALSAWKQFHRKYLEQAPPAPDALASKQLEDGHWVSVQVAKGKLFIALEANGEQAAEKVLRGALESMNRGE